MNFKAVLALPITASSAQTHKSISFIWIVWSTLYVYLWVTYKSKIELSNDFLKCKLRKKKCLISFIWTETMNFGSLFKLPIHVNKLKIKVLRREQIMYCSSIYETKKTWWMQRFIPSLGNIETAMWVFNCLSIVFGNNEKFLHFW